MTFQTKEFVRMPPRYMLCRWLNICSYFISLLMMSQIGPRGDRKSWQPLLKRASLSAPRPAASSPRAVGFVSPPHLPGHQPRSDAQPRAGQLRQLRRCKLLTKKRGSRNRTPVPSHGTPGIEISTPCTVSYVVRRKRGELQGGAR